MQLLFFSVVLGLILVILSPVNTQGSRGNDRSNCRPLTATFCQGVGYSTSLHPSGVLGYSLTQLGPIVESACSAEVATLMCRVAVPECNPDDDNRLKPCRALCEKVKTDCEATVRAKRLTWPSRLRCEALPESNCVQTQGSRGNDRSNCRPLTATFCQGVGYSTSLHPSGVLGYSLTQLGPIVESACSAEVATLMCRVAVPECNPDDDNRLKPCRALCEKVKTDCEATVRAKRLTWPSRLRCEALPESNCVQGSSSRPQNNPVLQPSPTGTCEPLTVPLCQGLGYTETVLPNRLGHRTQAEAGQAIHQYSPLVKVGCSPQLKPFVCSVYAPECVSGKAKPPCKRLCEQARSGCESLMNKFDFRWPDSFNCDLFTTESCEPDLDFGPTPAAKCEPITVPLCRGLPYTETVLPNVMGHETQDQAAIESLSLAPLVRVECSPHLKPFLCSVYTPECVSGKARPPCRTLCEQARSDCQSLMDRFGFQWPQALRCEGFTTESCEHYGVGSTGGICEPISIPMCQQDLSYNMTITPNLLGHTSQREAVVKMSFFNSIVQTVCALDIRIFVCRVYAPQCVAGEVQRPCRSFCERARRGCEGLMTSFGVSWPLELQCNKFPEEMCVSEDSSTEMMNAEGVLAKLNAAGYSVRGKSLTLKTARLLLIYMDADQSGDLDTVEFFKLEHYAAVIRTEYLESYEGRNAVTQTQLKKALSARDFKLDDKTFRILWNEHRSHGGIDYDEYVALLTKLQILKDRFQARLLNVPCDCQVSSFSLDQFIKSAII